MAFSSFDSLFFPPIPADTSAKTLSGSPSSFLADFESESPSSFRGEDGPALEALFEASLAEASSESAEADTATCTLRVADACTGGAVAGAGG